MSYKISQPAFNPIDNSWNLATTQSLTLYQSVTDNVCIGDPSIATGWRISADWLNTSSTSTINPAIICINLNKFIGSTITSVKMYYGVTHSAVPQTQVLAFSMNKRGKTWSASSQVLAKQNAVYTTINAPTSLTSSTISETISADTPYYISLYNETGTNAAINQSVYGFDIAISGVNKIYTLNSK